MMWLIKYIQEIFLEEISYHNFLFYCGYYVIVLLISCNLLFCIMAYIEVVTWIKEKKRDLDIIALLKE